MLTWILASARKVSKFINGELRSSSYKLSLLPPLHIQADPGNLWGLDPQVFAKMATPLAGKGCPQPSYRVQ